MKQEWTNEDIERLNFLIEENGKSKGIKLFSRETNRTENSIRIKLARIAKEITVQYAEEKAYEELNKSRMQNSNFFTKLLNYFRNIFHK